MLPSQNFPNLVSVLFLPNVFGAFWKLGFWFCFVFLVLVWYEAMQREVAYSITRILKSALIFTELIMAFAEAEALVRIQEVADNWAAVDCQNLLVGFFPQQWILFSIY